MKFYLFFIILILSFNVNAKVEPKKISIKGYDKHSVKDISGDVSISGESSYWIAVEATEKSTGDVHSILYNTKEKTIVKIVRPQSSMKIRGFDPLRVKGINEEASYCVGDDKSTGKAFYENIDTEIVTFVDPDSDYYTIHFTGVNDSEYIVGYLEGPKNQGDPGKIAFYKESLAGDPVLYQYSDSDETICDSLNNSGIAICRASSSNGWITFSFDVLTGEIVEVLDNPNDLIRSFRSPLPPLYDLDGGGYNNGDVKTIGYTTNQGGQLLSGVLWDTVKQSYELIQVDGNSTTVDGVNESGVVIGSFENDCGKQIYIGRQIENIEVDYFPYWNSRFDNYYNDNRLYVGVDLYADDVPIEFLNGENVSFEIIINVKSVSMAGTVDASVYCYNPNYCVFNR